MRSRCSVFVDAGYLLAAAATRVTGTSLRNGIAVQYPGLIDAILQEAAAVSGLPVLRLHWYDAARNAVPDTDQERIGELPQVKVRLGRFGVDGQQKGVDLRIGLDLITHARNHAAEVFFLVSGDDDLTEAVEEAQAHGVQVILLAVPNAQGVPHSVSRHLLRAADSLALLPSQAIDATVSNVGAAGHPTGPTPLDVRRSGHPTPNDLGSKGSGIGHRDRRAAETTENAGAVPQDWRDGIDAVTDKVLKSFLNSASPESVAALTTDRPAIPREIDRALLIDLSESLGVYDLSDSVRVLLRERFWASVDKATRVPAGSSATPAM